MSIIDDQTLSQIGYCFEQGYAVTVNQENALHFSHSRGLPFKKLFITTKTKFSNQKLAQILSETVKSRQSRSIQENSTDRALEIAKHFIKSKVLTTSDPFLVELKRDLTAARLGVSSEALKASPGFQTFAEKTHLHRYLLRFNHSLAVDPETKKISILRQNRMTPWKEVSLKIKYKQGAWTGHYSKNGIESHSRYDWKQFEPYATGNPNDWGNQYVFEYVIWRKEPSPLSDNPKTIEDKPMLAGIHAYVRLKTPDKEDNIYSVGLYRPDKHIISFNPFRRQEDGSFNLFHVLSIRKGRLMQPDESEFWGGRFSTLSVAITKEQFLTIKQKIEKDQAEDKLIYQLTHNNCNGFAADIAQIAGLEIPSFVPIVCLALPVTDETTNAVPRALRKIGSYIAAAALNTFGLICGSTRVNHDAQRADRSPLINSLSDLFDPSKAEFSHPGMQVRAFKKIKAWREAQIAPLQKELDRHQSKIDEIRSSISKIHFEVPDEYKT